MTDKTVIMFHPQGSNGALETWEPIPESSIASGTPVQAGCEYLNLDQGGLTAGVWDCTEWESVKSNYDVDEFMIVLEGSIIVEHENGNIQTFSAGDCFIIPKGVPCIWRQVEYVKKYYFIFDTGAEIKPMSSLDAIKVVVPEMLPSIDSGDSAQYIGSAPQMGLESVYKDSSGQFQVGIWECNAMTRQPGIINRSEIMHILEGSGSITNGDGVVFKFKAGDTFLVPLGMGYQWHNDEPVKKIFCALTPS